MKKIEQERCWRPLVLIILWLIMLFLFYILVWCKEKVGPLMSIAESMMKWHFYLFAIYYNKCMTKGIEPIYICIRWALCKGLEINNTQMSITVERKEVVCNLHNRAFVPDRARYKYTLQQYLNWFPLFFCSGGFREPQRKDLIFSNTATAMVSEKRIFGSGHNHLRLKLEPLTHIELN